MRFSCLSAFSARKYKHNNVNFFFFFLTWESFRDYGLEPWKLENLFSLYPEISHSGWVHKTHASSWRLVVKKCRELGRNRAGELKPG